MPSTPILIGITGNYGSGKSSFSRLIRDRGYQVISADELAQEQLDAPDSLKQIAKRWGRQIIKKGRADRHQIAQIVFNSKLELDWLNNLLHPKTLAELQNITDHSNADYLFFEVPILFEAGMQRCFDYLVLVHTDKAISMRRLKKRDQTSAAEIQARLDNQIDDSQKIPLCNLVIDNNSTLRKLQTQVDSFLAKLGEIKPKDKLSFIT